MSNKRKCIFNKDLENQYKFIKKNNTNSHVKCDKCNSLFSIANGGKSDIVQHLKTVRHKQADLASSSSSLITSFVRKQGFNDNERHLAVIEGTWAYHTIQHNQSFRSTDCTSKLISKCFEGKYACARTKATAIVSNVFEIDSMELLKDDLSNINCVSIYSDCSNHGCIKICPILVRYFLPR